MACSAGASIQLAVYAAMQDGQGLILHVVDLNVAHAMLGEAHVKLQQAPPLSPTLVAMSSS